MSKIYALPPTVARDIPAMLCKVAEEIEAGTYGEVNECVLVRAGKEVGIHYSGDNIPGSSAVLLLQVGCSKIINGVIAAYE